MCNMPNRRVVWLLLVCLGIGMGLAACATEPIHKDATASHNAPVVLYYEEGAQIEIVGPQNQRVLIDVTDPQLLSRPADENDILLTTHFHFDHFNQKFIDTFPGKQLLDRQGEMQRPGWHIKGIASFHSEQDYDPSNPAWDNYIFVVDIGGLRIAHFGDIGQKEFTPEQMKILGQVDVAITQFVNPYSQMSLDNKKGYHLMAQLKPKVIIPHHGASDESAIRLAGSHWQVVCARDHRLLLSQETLPTQTTVIVMGEMSGYMQKTLNLKLWP